MTVTKKNRLLILYGSQTGQAEAISREVFDRCSTELDLLDNNIELIRYPLDQVEKKLDLEKENLAVFVVSTTGEGEPPDNALRFWRRVRKKTHPDDYLSHFTYGLLGLGDSNYNRFANFARDLDNRLEALSARRFLPTGFADDAVGLESGVEPWIDSLLLSLPSVLGISVLERIPTVMATISDASTDREPSLTSSSPSLASLTQLSLPSISARFKDIKVEFAESSTSTNCDQKTLNSLECMSLFPKLPVMQSELFTTEIINVRELTTGSTDDPDEKVILEAEVLSEVAFSPGDSFGFIPGNADEEVNEILDIIRLKDRSNSLLNISVPSTLTHIPQQVTLRDLLKYFMELRSVPKKSFLRHLADFTSDPAENRRLLELSSKEGADDYHSFIRVSSVNIMDLLRVFKSCRPNLECLMANLPCFVPRYYSVINFVNEKEKIRGARTFKIAFSVTRTKSCHSRCGSQKFGLFTGLLYQHILNTTGTCSDSNIEDALEKLDMNQQVELKLIMKAFKRKNEHFLLENLTAPLILVGPGTGVAPFLGFLEKRRHAIKNGGMKVSKSWLFFGCRSPREFIYEKELRQHQKERTLDNLKICFSRQGGDTAEGKYVQDLIRSNQTALYPLLKDPKCLIYVCGDMKSMSVEVFNAFIAVFEQDGKVTHENAVEHMRDMQSAKRYLQDIWT